MPNEANSDTNEVLRLYDELHKIPELAFKEFKTADFIASSLSAAGLNVIKNVGDTTGVIAEIRSSVDGPGLAIRADMDALGHIIDGKLEPRHTCGHDAHSAMLLSAAKQIYAEGLVKRGFLRFIFQPAEEIGEGAMKLAEIKEVMDGLTHIAGLHIRPIQECRAGQAIPAMYFASTATLTIEVIGIPAHAARPHLGVNALDASVLIISTLNALHFNPNKPHSIKATRLICDSGATNSIPDLSTLTFDIRAQFNETMDEIKEKVITALESASASIGARVNVLSFKSMPAAIIDEEFTKDLREVCISVVGKDNTLAPMYIPGGEDFFYFGLKDKNIRLGFMGLGVDAAPGLHHKDMSLNKDSLKIGVNIHKSLVNKLLG